MFFVATHVVTGTVVYMEVADVRPWEEPRVRKWFHANGFSAVKVETVYRTKFMKHERLVKNLNAKLSRDVKATPLVPGPEQRSKAAARKAGKLTDKQFEILKRVALDYAPCAHYRQERVTFAHLEMRKLITPKRQRADARPAETEYTLTDLGKRYWKLLTKE